MAPEQCAGLPIDERVDVFALGVILYELVTGERPLRGDTIGSILEATLAWTADFRDGNWRHVPARFRALIVRMLAREPSQRFANGAQVLAEFHELSVDATTLGKRIDQ